MSFLKNLDVGSIGQALAGGVKAAQEGVSNIDVGKIVKNASDAAATGVKAVQEGVSNIDIGEAVENAKEAVASGANSIGKTVESITRKDPDNEEESISPSRKMVELLWCMAFADEVVTDDEREALNELSGAIDADFELYQTDIEREFGLLLAENSREFGHAAAVKLEAKRIIESFNPTFTEAKLLCWNLLALASSDGLDDSELDLIRFISKQLGLEASIVEELRNYSDAIVETGRASRQLKHSSRSYNKIEPLVAELEKRERILVEAAQSLIADK